MHVNHLQICYSSELWLITVLEASAAEREATEFAAIFAAASCESNKEEQQEESFRQQKKSKNKTRTSTITKTRRHYSVCAIVNNNDET
jgi:hypothetical protein